MPGVWGWAMTDDIRHLCTKYDTTHSASVRLVLAERIAAVAVQLLAHAGSRAAGAAEERAWDAGQVVSDLLEARVDRIAEEQAGRRDATLVARATKGEK